MGLAGDLDVEIDESFLIAVIGVSGENVALIDPASSSREPSSRTMSRPCQSWITSNSAGDRSVMATATETHGRSMMYR